MHTRFALAVCLGLALACASGDGPEEAVPSSPGETPKIGTEATVPEVGGVYDHEQSNLIILQDGNELTLHYDAVFGAAHICECDLELAWDGDSFSADHADLQVSPDELIFSGGLDTEIGCCGANWPGDGFERRYRRDLPEPLGAEPYTSDVPTHCGNDEATVFTCAMKDSDKVLSVCRSPVLDNREGHMWYRYGRPGAAELEYPKKDVHPSGAFTQATMSAAPRLNGWSLSFTNEEHQYVVFNNFSHGETEVGVTIHPPGAATITLHCDPEQVETSRVPHPFLPDTTVIEFLARVRSVSEKAKTAECMEAEQREEFDTWLAEAYQVESALDIMFLERDGLDADMASQFVRCD